MDDPNEFMSGIAGEVRASMVREALNGKRDSAIYLYEEFISRVENEEDVDVGLQRFVAGRLKDALTGDVLTAMRLKKKQGRQAGRHGERACVRDFKIITRFVELMKERKTDKPSHVQDEVGSEFYLSGDAVYRIYAREEKNDGLGAAKAALALKEETKGGR